MAKNERPDPRALFNKFTLSKHGRTRAVTYKKPRDRLLDSLGNQIEMVHLLKERCDPKTEGHKERKMFSENRGRYVVQIKYNSVPLDLTSEADTVEVENLEQVEEVLNHAITLANVGHFDDQIERNCRGVGQDATGQARNTGVRTRDDCANGIRTAGQVAPLTRSLRGIAGTPRYSVARIERICLYHKHFHLNAIYSHIHRHHLSIRESILSPFRALRSAESRRMLGDSA